MNILSNLFTEMAMEEGEGQGESADVQGDEPGPSAPSGEGQTLIYNFVYKCVEKFMALGGCFVKSLISHVGR